jgi:hypothetical protein
LAQAVDLEHAAAGDRIEGRLGTLMREAPAGAKVEGRLMRVELQHSGAPERTVALRWETIEINGLKIPLTLKPDRRLPSTKVPPRGNLQRRGIEIELPRPGEEKYGVYHFPASRRVMDSGYRTEWVTVEKASGARRGGPER